MDGGHLLSAVWDDDLAEYDFGPGHPLAPVRVQLTIALARALGVFDHDTVTVIEPEAIGDDILLTVHHPDYLVAVQAGDEPRQDRGVQVGDVAGVSLGQTTGHLPQAGQREADRGDHPGRGPRMRLGDDMPPDRIAGRAVGGRVQHDRPQLPQGDQAARQPTPDGGPVQLGDFGEDARRRAEQGLGDVGRRGRHGVLKTLVFRQ